jgi:hypothetical protein
MRVGGIVRTVPEVGIVEVRIGIVEVREDEEFPTGAPMGDPSAIEPAGPELSTSRETSIRVAAAGESTDVAVRVTRPNGGRCRATSQGERERAREEESNQPTVPMSRAGHDQTREATTVPASMGDGSTQRASPAEPRA